MALKIASFFFILAISSLFRASFPAFLVPVTKDSAAEKYTLPIYLRTPPRQVYLLLDLGATFTLIDCSKNYASSSYHSIPCGSPLCSSLGPHSCSVCSGLAGPGCSNNSCALHFTDSGARKSTVMGEALMDSLSLPVTNGRNPGPFGTIHNFIFSCTKGPFHKAHVKGTSGSAGFGRSKLSVPAQLSKSFKEKFLFTLCLSGSPSAPGVVFFGSPGPYYFLPEIDLSKHLIYTPLLSPQLSNGYFIGLTSIKVNEKVIWLTNEGLVPTKISTMTPYTTLRSAIFKAFAEAFVNESAAADLKVREPVKPFSICYNADDIADTPVGPAVPTVDLVMQNDDAVWRIFGSNSMVRIFRGGVDAWCLGFLDGGDHPKAPPIVIGGHQIEDNLWQFDVESERVGFSGNVLVHGTMCANFNFTKNEGLLYI
ncbi:probable aspartic proteinase GIP1 [Primulina huaijiensis]|uniref:probable aspartic proteinase GIP1 n=1 Tax=Primulina huaijiensis TaxID=1492673 RepID=UPI003CC725C8